jgi:predicted RNase H-like nuclease
VPARTAFEAADYPGACAAAYAASDPPRKISKQMFHLFPKIREVDSLMTPALQARVFECHPETAFFVMNGQQVLPEPKKRGGRMHRPGLDLRCALLTAQGFSGAFLSQAMVQRGEARADDVLDACACAWTAARIFRGEAIRFPDAPPLDAKGLRMEILA